MRIPLMRRWPAGSARPVMFGLLLVLVLLAGLLPGQVVAQGQTLHWEEYNVTIDLHEDGTFTVTEDQYINFTSSGSRLLPQMIIRLESIQGCCASWSSS